MKTLIDDHWNSDVQVCTGHVMVIQNFNSHISPVLSDTKNTWLIRLKIWHCSNIYIYSKNKILGSFAAVSKLNQRTMDSIRNFCVQSHLSYAIFLCPTDSNTDIIWLCSLIWALESLSQEKTDQMIPWRIQNTTYG